MIRFWKKSATKALKLKVFMEDFSRLQVFVYYFRSCFATRSSNNTINEWKMTGTFSFKRILAKLISFVQLMCYIKMTLNPSKWKKKIQYQSFNIYFCIYKKKMRYWHNQRSILTDLVDLHANINFNNNAPVNYP